MKLSPVDYISQIADLTTHLAKPGLLLAVPDVNRPANVMTIGWALFGRVWEEPMCIVMVRPSRYTCELLNSAGVFTINRMPDGYDKAVLRCGTVSGRQVDKVAEQGWTALPGQTQNAPFLQEASLHLECRTVLTARVTEALPANIKSKFYGDGDLHTIYFGQVTGVFRHDS